MHAVSARGLGTVAANPGGVVVITHDHWGDLLDTAMVARFSDAHGRPLVELTGREFRRAILYRDGGTLMLRAPAGLATEVAAFGDGEPVGPGVTVQILHRRAGRDHAIEVVDAVVESIAWKERPVYTLRSVDGQSILPGDSGGGIWLDGRLQGNMWTTVMIRQILADGTVRDVATDSCVAAIHLQTVHTLHAPAPVPTVIMPQTTVAHPS
jgi:hypothetical protein